MRIDKCPRPSLVPAGVPALIRPHLPALTRQRKIPVSGSYTNSSRMRSGFKLLVAIYLSRTTWFTTNYIFYIAALDCRNVRFLGIEDLSAYVFPAPFAIGLGFLWRVGNMPSVCFVNLKYHVSSKKKGAVSRPDLITTLQTESPAYRLHDTRHGWPTG